MRQRTYGINKHEYVKCFLHTGQEVGMVFKLRTRQRPRRDRRGLLVDLLGVIDDDIDATIFLAALQAGVVGNAVIVAKAFGAEA